MKKGIGAERMTRASGSRLAIPLTLAALAGFAAWTLFWEPAMRLRVARWRLYPPEWRGRDPVRIVVISDLHAGAAHVSPGRVSRIVEHANALEPDIAVVMGDVFRRHPGGRLPADSQDLVARLGCLDARIARVAVPRAFRSVADSVRSGRVLALAGITVLENSSLRVGDGDNGFWLAGVPGLRHQDVDHSVILRAAALEQALSAVTDDAPVVLLSCETELFPLLDMGAQSVPVQISGETPPWLDRANTPYGRGRYDEDGRSLIVAAALGGGAASVRAGWSAEITVVDIAEPGGVDPLRRREPLANKQDPV